MNALLVIEHRFKRKPNNKIYSSSNSVSIELWNRYLCLFDKLTVVARIENVNEDIDSKYLVSQERVEFIPIPYYVGAKEFILNAPAIYTVLKKALFKNTAYILRLPSISGAILSIMLHKRKIPYVVELVGDPWEALDSNSIKSSLSVFHKYRSTYLLKWVVSKAAGVIYVTEHTLQKRYRPKSGAPVASASNVLLPRDQISTSPKVYDKNPLREEVKLISIGSLSQLYKSPDIAIQAVQLLRGEGFNVSLTWLGDGKYFKQMQILAEELGMEKHIYFLGNVSKETVMDKLLESDLYIHPSKTEGLPRAIIEAMAKGLPVIASNVGGIHELISVKGLIDTVNPFILSLNIKRFIINKDLMNSEAIKNLAKANRYEFSKLKRKREDIYTHLKQIISNQS